MKRISLLKPMLTPMRPQAFRPKMTTDTKTRMKTMGVYHIEPDEFYNLRTRPF